MGFFSKKPKPYPTIHIGEIRVNYDPESISWDFQYNGIEFISYRAEFHMPTPSQLDSMITDIESLRGEMISRIEKNEFGKYRVNSGERFLVNLDYFNDEGTCIVSWSNDEYWGDMAVDFDIKDHIIVEENWGD